MKTRSRLARSALVGLIGLAVTASVGCTVPIDPPPPGPTTTTTTAPDPRADPCQSGSPAIVCEQFEVDGLTRKYFYHLPSQAAPARGRPLVLWFHGDGGTGNANLSSLYAQTDPDGALVVQLDGPNNIAALNRGSTAWSFFMDGTAPDDVHFTKTVIDGILDGSFIPGATVDPHRIYAIGSSRGGFMVNTLTVDARTQGYFPGVVDLWGSLYCEDGDDVCTNRMNSGFGTPAPVLQIHGDSDGAVPPPATVPNPPTNTISWPWPLAQFAYANGCSGDYAYRATLNPSMGSKPTYLYQPSGTCAKDFQLVLIKGGGHGVSGWEAYSWNYLKTKTRP